MPESRLSYELNLLSIEILENIADGFVCLDSNWKYTFVNKAACKLLGKDQEQLIGNSIWEVFPEAKNQAIYEISLLALETKQVQSIREYYNPWDRWFDNRIYPTENGLTIIFTDVTKEVNKENKTTQQLEIFQLYNKFLDNSFDSFQVAREDGYLVYVNDVGLKQLGISKDDIRSTHVCDFEDDFKSIKDWQDHVSEMKQVKRMIFESTNTNLSTGKQFPVEITISHEIIDNVGYIIANARDISKRKHAESQLEKTQHLTANVLESMNDGFSMLDVEGNHLMVNSAFCEMLGFEEHELIGSGVPHKYWPKEHLEDIQKAFGKVISGEKSEFQLKFKRKNGEIFPVIVSPSKVLNDEGEVISYIATVKDITELELAQNMVLKSEQRLRIILESTKIGIWDLDLTTLKTMRTIEHDRCFGFTNFHPHWDYQTFLDCVHPDDRKKVDENYQNALENDTFYNVDYRVVWADGSIHWLNSTGKLIYNADDEPERVIGTVQDISDRMERELLLKQSMREKDSLVAEVHHRVKNNLAVIAGLMYLQVIDTDNEELKDRLSINMNRIKSIATIHEELYRSQDFSKISFSQFIRDQVNMLKDSRTTQAEVKIEYDLAPLFLDINQALPCALILNELLSNCFKHAINNHSDPKIWIQLHKIESNIILTIKDNGPGISGDFTHNNAHSMGLNLVATLCDQIDATRSFDSKNGFSHTISFKDSI
ncbi:MAG: PAS domain S-box protein [Balneolaceae bacterium]|nr:PAS domain S-box protein [Balneolaceae bacterium]